MQQYDDVLTLYARHADSARALASRLLCDRGEAEDVVHDVFLTLWCRPVCFDAERGTARAWLMTVVRNRAMDHLRRRFARADLADVLDRLPDPGHAGAADALESTVRAERLWQLVDDLPRAQADLIRRAFARGQTHQEIALETGLPLGTVKSRIRLGLEKLRGAVRGAATLDRIAC